MSLGASTTDIANDVSWDLANDRRHPCKCLRPFASGGQWPIPHGVGCALTLLAPFAASPSFVGMLAFYLVLATAYIGFLKTRVLADALLLSLLDTPRLVTR